MTTSSIWAAYSLALNNLKIKWSLVLILNYPFRKAIVSAVSLPTAGLNVDGFIKRLGMITPSLTESFYLFHVDPLAENVRVIIYSNFTILLDLKSPSKHWI